MQDNLTCDYHNKAGEVLKTEPCTLDHTIGNLLYYVTLSEEKYGHVDIHYPAKPHVKISIFESNFSTFAGSTSSVMEVAFEINVPISINSTIRNLQFVYTNYLEKTIDPFKSHLLVGCLDLIKIDHLENNLSCNFFYELVEGNYNYMVDVYTLLEQAKQLEEYILNFEKN